MIAAAILTASFATAMLGTAGGLVFRVVVSAVPADEEPPCRRRPLVALDAFR